MDALTRLADLDAALRDRRGGGAREVAEGVSARELTRLLEISRAMHRIHDRDRLLAYVNDRLRELFDAQHGFVVLFGPDGKPVIQSSSSEGAGGGTLPVSETLLERVRTTREPVIVDDTSSDTGLRDQSSIERLRIASALCAPLIVEDEVIGVLQFDQRGEPHPFPESDLRLLTLFADLVATALYNMQLIERLNGALDDMQAAQEQLVRAERLSALGEMAAGIAHNFNNTLFVALGLCDVLLAKNSLEEDARTAVRRIRTCALDAASTVRRLQIFTRGRPLETAEGSVVPSEIVEEMKELTRHKWGDEARKRGLSLSLETEARPTPPVRAAAAEIREVLTNLVFNAVDAMAESGTITIRSWAEGEKVLLSVTDEGVGMDEATRSQLFEPFFTTKGARGYGFGLSTSWSIVHRLGGSIDVVSEPGEGSTFTVRLPVAGDDLEVGERTEVESPRRARILVVDDDPVVLDTVSQLVQVLGHHASGYTSAEQALEVFASGSFDAVVSDLGMPGLTGNDVANEVHRMKPGTPVILLTGWGSDVELAPDVGARVADVLAKPVTIEGLGESLLRTLFSTRS